MPEGQTIGDHSIGDFGLGIGADEGTKERRDGATRKAGRGSWRRDDGGFDGFGPGHRCPDRVDDDLGLAVVLLLQPIELAGGT